ncbi:hypothetical protein MRX96_024634 [Rhipicephalus microplus]
MAQANPRVQALNQFQRTRWDTNEVIARAFKQRNYLEQLYRTTTYIPGGAIGLQAHIIVARGAAILYRAEDIESLTLCLAVANGIAPGLTHLPVEAANARVVRCLVQFLQTEITKRGLVEVSEAKWVELTQPRSEQPPHPKGVLADIAWLPKARDQLKNMAVPDRVGDTDVAQILSALNLCGRRFLTVEGVNTLYAAAFLGFAKKGHITARKLEAVLAQMQEEIGYTMSLTPQIIKDMWNYVGSHIPYDVLPQMFKTWEEATELPLRMRVTLQQAAWTGLTQYANHPQNAR